jgi:REP element-mobilizing transposase RayT
MSEKCIRADSKPITSDHHIDRGTGGPPVIGSEENSHGRAAHATKKRGTGGPPVIGSEENSHGRTAHATATLVIRQGAYLPHWTLTTGGLYAVTYRLADSLPRAVLERFVMERDELIRKEQRKSEGLSDLQMQELMRLHSQRIEAALDAGSGACWLKRPEIAERVVGNWLHFDGQRYCLHAWCVMPNHVHVLLEPLTGFTLADIVHSWKSFTAKFANKLLGRSGNFWQPEYYDHLIRDDADYTHAIWYIEQNPAKAGLTDWCWVSRGTGGPPVKSCEKRDARTTQK